MEEPFALDDKALSLRVIGVYGVDIRCPVRRTERIGSVFRSAEVSAEPNQRAQARQQGNEMGTSKTPPVWAGCRLWESFLFQTFHSGGGTTLRDWSVPRPRHVQGLTEGQLSDKG